MNLIAAVDLNWAIGRDGDQLCYIPADLKRFQALTTGHPVILGRKTLGHLPRRAAPEKPADLILSRDSAFAPEGAEVSGRWRPCGRPPRRIPSSSGGESVYAALLDWCDTAYITKIGPGVGGGGRLFPRFGRRPGLGDGREGEPQEHAGIPFRYVIYRRRKPHVCG